MLKRANYLDCFLFCCSRQKGRLEKATGNNANDRHLSFFQFLSERGGAFCRGANVRWRTACDSSAPIKTGVQSWFDVFVSHVFHDIISPEYRCGLNCASVAQLPSAMANSVEVPPDPRPTLGILWLFWRRWQWSGQTESPPRRSAAMKARRDGN
ncbi:hypothetical protein BJX76DRAFT_248759 [Aspergillus varians]